MEKRIVYLDGVDFQHEIGAATGGNRVYPSAADLKKNNPCWDRCGIVEAEVTLVRWVEPQNFKFESNEVWAMPDVRSHLEKVRDHHARMLENVERRLRDLGR